MGMEDLVKLIGVMDIPYHGTKIESVGIDEEGHEITVCFENGEDIRDELYHLCNSVTGALFRKDLLVDFSDDSERMDSYHKHHLPFFRLPKEFFIGANHYETKAVYCAKITKDKTVLISLHNEGAFIAGYSATELMKAIYACIKKIRGEEKDEPAA